MQNCYNCKNTGGYVTYNNAKTYTPRYMPSPTSYTTNYKVNAGGAYAFKAQNKVA